MVDLELHYLGFIGSCAISLFLLREYVLQSLKSSKKPKTLSYIKPRLLIVFINIMLGQILITVEEYGVDFYADVFDKAQYVDLYIDHAEFISFLTGLLSTVIFAIVLSKIKSKLSTV